MAGVVLAGALLGGCVSQEPTITIAEAQRRVEANVRGLVEGLDPAPRLEPLGGLRTSACNPASDGSTGRELSSVAYWLRDVPAERNQDVFDAARRHWADAGWVVVSERTDPPVLEMMRPGDEFTMSLQQAGTTTDLSLGSTSPCVWPDGTPPAAE